MILVNLSFRSTSCDSKVASIVAAGKVNASNQPDSEHWFLPNLFFFHSCSHIEATMASCALSKCYQPCINEFL
jgi:hypothetical protein